LGGTGFATAALGWVAGLAFGAFAGAFMTAAGIFFFTAVVIHSFLETQS
jgi:hypothetical protein